jgi:hypothetical protein
MAIVQNYEVPRDLGLALDDFAESAEDLLREWEKHPDATMTNGYPFKRSFDEVMSAIYEWRHCNT